MAISESWGPKSRVMLYSMSKPVGAVRAVRFEGLGLLEGLCG